MSSRGGRAPSTDVQPARAVPAAAIVLVGCLALIFLEWRRDHFGFYEDEGINLLKAYLVAGGHPLYREVYSDQAPLYTWILAAAIKLVGADYERLRQIAIAFGALGLAAIFAVTAELGGLVAGAVTVVLLSCLAPIQKFFTSVVISTPGLALGCCGLYAALAARRHLPPTRAAAAGAMLGLACASKLAFAYLLLPTALALALRRRLAHGSGASWAALQGWLLAGWAAALLLVAAFCDVKPMLPQLVGPHWAAWAAFTPEARESRQALLLGHHLVPLYLGAAIAAAVIVRRAPSTLLVLGPWLALSASWMLVYRPIWAHHLPEILLPGAVAVGVAAAASGRPWLASPYGLPAAVAALALCLASVTAYDEWRVTWDNVPRSALERVGDEIAAATRPDDWVLVDRPIVAFSARRQVPPALAMISRKRIATGDLTGDSLLAALGNFRPRVVALCGAAFRPFTDFGAAVTASYTLAASRALEWEFTSRSTPCQLYVAPPPK
jgi:hypothetical protein